MWPLAIPPIAVDPTIKLQSDQRLLLRYLAFSASLRTADMARQIGSALVDKEGTLISVGSNDVPAFGGGQYPKLHLDERDHARGFDTNTIEVEKIKKDVSSKFIENFLETFEVDDSIKTDITHMITRNFTSSLKPISNITEYFRSVHAEMEAILAATRTGRSPLGGTIYTTTFPCHNCAKHIVGAGIERVVYIEPYGKSKAASLHADSISLQFDSVVKDRVCFQPFFGVGPRRFWDLFSLHMSTGNELERKDPDGKKKNFKPEIANMRLYSPLPAVKAMEGTAIEVFKKNHTKPKKAFDQHQIKLARRRLNQKKTKIK
ncbi:MAG TPA: deaminase [Oligoflexus sp.]|uniref:deaminase n=1 Tax=Oligoflexus sp. TaxID=1971216 RepID=UPI002D5772C4|nr:deaminase [Oligoflexus sp.]HYX37504.1 deaminase [Oligoflexus sp.]